MNASRPGPLADLKGIRGNEYNLRQLTTQIQTSIGVIPFVGAGLSVPIGFPTWSGFLLEQAEGPGIQDRIQQRLRAGEYEEAAEDLLAALEYRAFHDAIDDAFGTYKLKGKKLTGAVSYLPRLAAGPVITTNFDHVLEEVFKQAGCAFEYVVWGAHADIATKALSQSRRFLLKIHGDVEDSTDHVLTRQDYAEQYGSTDGSVIDIDKPLPRLLGQMLVARPLLFLGCSLNQDRTVAVLKRITQDYPAVVHYAVVEQPASVEELRERSRFLSGCGIRLIWYPNGRHDLIELLLACLSGQDLICQPFEPELILIPEGKFLMGSDPKKDKYARDNEQPQHNLYLPAYYIARTPTTNAQYLAFVQAKGHATPDHWKNGKPPKGKDDHPVVNVSWYDAMDYCQWLSKETGKSYCLPSEAEWEKAARGTDGRIYPWGDQWDAGRCNSFDGEKDTTPVGSYPLGASPYDVLDMAGNVLEYTRSLWGKDWEKPDYRYPYDPADKRENESASSEVHRVLRGGSFLSPAYDVRCASRYWIGPNYRRTYYGFRVVVALGSALGSGSSGR